MYGISHHANEQMCSMATMVMPRFITEGTAEVVSTSFVFCAYEILDYCHRTEGK